MKTKLGIIFGGVSVEHEISIITAMETISYINKDKYEVVPIYIGKNGLMYTGDELLNLEAFKDMETLLKNVNQVTLINNGDNVSIIKYPLQKFKNNIISTLDVAFPVMHGTNGEDGTIQGYLELLRLPYVGCDILSSSVGMDKIIMKKVLKESGLPVVDYISFYSMEYLHDENKIIKEIDSKLNYPVIVKAGNLGSSVGIKKASNKKELKSAIEFAIEFSDRVLVENAVVNLKEINCSVMGTMTDCKPSVLEEPIMKSEILSYTDKYLGGSKTEGMASEDKILPANVSVEMKEEIQDLAMKTFKVLGCSGVSRVDFLVDNDTNKIYVNEINTIPGALSYYLWEATGESFGEEIDELINLAFKRKRDRSERIYSYDQNILALVGSGKFKGSKK